MDRRRTRTQKRTLRKDAISTGAALRSPENSARRKIATGAASNQKPRKPWFLETNPFFAEEARAEPSFPPNSFEDASRASDQARISLRCHEPQKDPTGAADHYESDLAANTGTIRLRGPLASLDPRIRRRPAYSCQIARSLAWDKSFVSDLAKDCRFSFWKTLLIMRSRECVCGLCTQTRRCLRRTAS